VAETLKHDDPGMIPSAIKAVAQFRWYRQAYFVLGIQMRSGGALSDDAVAYLVQGDDNDDDEDGGGGHEDDGLDWEALDALQSSGCEQQLQTMEFA
jgi:hypothetical protein